MLAMADNKADLSIGARVRGLRTRRILTQEQLAVKSGVSAATIRRIESDRLAPRFITIQRLADAFGITPVELAGTEP